MRTRSAHLPPDSWRAHVGSAQSDGGSVSTQSEQDAGGGGGGVGSSTSQGSSGSGVGSAGWGALKGSLHGTVTK